MYLVSIGEIFLKGDNRNIFERILMKNIRKALNLDPNDLQRHRNRYLVLKDENINKLQLVFGVNSYSKVTKCDLDKIKENALSLINNEKSFRVSSRKMFSLNKTSMEMNEEIGSYIVENKNIKVDLEKPEINIRIEEISKKAYLYKEIIKGPGGLPTSSAGFVYLRINNEISSTVAAYLMMKRGCTIALSKDLKLIHKFEFAFELRIREERENDFIVSDETFEDLKLEEDKQFIMRPLIGYSEKQIKEIYDKIKEL